MQATITAKIRINPNSKQELLLESTMQAYKDACNYVSNHIYVTHDLVQVSLNKNLYYILREKFKLGAQMAQSVLKTVIARYKTVLSTENKFILIKFKKPECDLVWNRDYSLVENLFSTNTLKGRIKLSYICDKYMSQFFKPEWSFGTAKLIFKHKKWFLHIPVTKDVSELDNFKVSNVTGVDLGINFLAVSYDSKDKSKFYKGRQVKQKRSSYKQVRQELQRRKTPSARRRLKFIGSRENRWMQDVNHVVSKALVESNPSGTLFVLEDLTGIRKFTERVKKKYRYVQVSWAFFDLRKKLEYKALLAGSKVITVSPKYTSQTCPRCGHNERSNRNKKTHIFKCKTCGYMSNDDRIGAMNLHRKGIEYLEAVTGE